jgi:uncharacterized membrane-anchored protein YhcB (DUF1043 family)
MPEWGRFVLEGGLTAGLVIAVWGFVTGQVIPRLAHLDALKLKDALIAELQKAHLETLAEKNARISELREDLEQARTEANNWQRMAFDYRTVAQTTSQTSKQLAAHVSPGEL